MIANESLNTPYCITFSAPASFMIVLKKSIMGIARHELSA